MRLSGQSRRDFLRVTGMGAVSIMFLGARASSVGEDALGKGFINPPDSAKPHTFWHWMNGNVTKEGISADLKAMKESGIGGVFLFVMEGQVTETVPVYVDKPIRHLTPEWFDMIRHSAMECRKLGMELSLMNCIGWTTSGGKWIPPEKSMMRVAWSNHYFKGPGRMKDSLQLPPCDYANYQNLTKTYPHIHESVPPDQRYYQDMAVLAYKLEPSTAKAASLWPPRLFCSEPGEHPAQAIDGDGSTSVSFKENGFLQLDFGEAVSVRGVEYLGHSCELQYGNDGLTWNIVAELPGPRVWGYPHSIPFPEKKARYFRLFYSKAGSVKNVKLYGDSLVHDYQPKSSFHGVWEDIKTAEDRIGTATPEWAVSTINSKDVLNLTRHLKADGKLDWVAPEGEWMITRIGCAPIGRLNAPSAREFVGLECNKLGADAVEFHFSQYAGRVIDELKDLVGSGIHAIHIDSWEAGDLNFTPKFIEEFYKRRGYDATPFLLVHGGGKIVDSPAISDRFLWDVRLTIGDLMADNYFAKLHELCCERGLKFQGENIGVMLGATVDQLKIKAHCDMPMGEFQMPNFIGGDSWARWDCVEASSAAHIYDKPITGAEGFTCFDRWITDPYGLKGVGDLAFAMGINRLVFHTWALNPLLDRAPGMTMGPFGVNFSRLNTWWGRPSKALLDYLQRCQYLLQQGMYVADILYFYGEGAPNTLPEKSLIKPALPDGYSYDGCDADSLISRVKVKDGRLVFPGGMSYKILVLKEDSRMTPELLIRLKELVTAGATVFGAKPKESPSLQNYPQCDEMVRQLADELWGELDEKKILQRSYGKGRIIWGVSVAEALKLMDVTPDVVFTYREGDNPIHWIHRRTNEADIYFITNQKNVIDHGLSLEIMDRRYDSLKINELEADAARMDISFRISGIQPEIWDAVKGTKRDLPEFRMEHGRTIVPLYLSSSGSCFIVFRKPINEPLTDSNRKNFPETKTAAEITGSWSVSFDTRWGGPSQVVFDNLDDWTIRQESGIKYYSGRATYRKTFNLDNMSLRETGKRLYLDLGRLRSIAEVRLNGKDLGVLWCPPWKVDVTGLLKKKNNKLEIDIINVWANRLIGDAGLPDVEKITWTSLNDTRWAIKPDNKLVPSGLYGPVMLYVQEI